MINKGDHVSSTASLMPQFTSNTSSATGRKQEARRYTVRSSPKQTFN